MMNIFLLDNLLYVDNVIIYQFQYDIKEFNVFNDKIIVLLKSPIKQNFNENIFCVDVFGNLKWQIEKTSHIYEDSPYDKIIKISELFIEAWNYDSNNYIVDVETGKILSQRFLK